MGMFDGIENVSSAPQATEAQIEYIYNLLDWLGDDRFVDDSMSREEASELIDDLKFELDTKRGR